MSNFKEKRQNKIERYRLLAEKNESMAEQRYGAYKNISSHIPLGQPILVGHHSEKGHRADIKRMDNHISKSVEHSKKAEYYREKAQAMESNTAIFIDDPEAITKIEDKLVAMKNLREAYKQFNKTWKKEGVEKALLAWPGNKESMQKLLDIYCQRFNHETQVSEFRDIGCLPSYLLTNLGMKIRRYEKKLKITESVQALDDEVLFDSQDIKICVQEGRINIYFNYVPSPELRQKLKRHPFGFKWSPTTKTWTRKITHKNQVSYLKQSLMDALGLTH